MSRALKASLWGDVIIMHYYHYFPEAPTRKTAQMAKVRYTPGFSGSEVPRPHPPPPTPTHTMLQPFKSILALALANVTQLGMVPCTEGLLV